MPLVINTNVSSLNAQRQITNSGGALDQASERLASGRRINSAADDAAGLSISNRITSQIRGLDQAVRNANDGVSLIQTAEGALDESTNILQRVRELAIQSSNGIYSDADRATLDAEVQQLIEELDRIAETTSFNGQNILDGTLESVKLQVGANAGETIEFSIQALDTASLGLGSTSSDLSGDRIADLTDIAGAGSTSFGDGDILINGQSLTAFNGGATPPDTLQTIIDDINTNLEGVTASGFNVVEANTVGTGRIVANESLTVSVFNVSDNSQTDFSITASEDLDDLVAQINTRTGGIVDASLNDNGRLVLSNSTGTSIGLTLNNDVSGLASTGTTLDDIVGVSGVSDPGGITPADPAEFIAGGTSIALFTGSLALSSDDGSDVSISKGANGVDADLANLGFRETSSGEVSGIALDTAAQDTALAAGDLSINGTSIAATTTTEGLQGKIDNINDVSSATGVVANARAEQSFGFDSDITPVEVIAENAYVTPASASFQELHNVSGVLIDDASVAAAATNFTATDGISFDVDDNAGGGTTTNVQILTAHTTVDALLADINGQLTAGGTDVEAFQDSNNKLAFRATVTGGDILVDNAGEVDSGTVINTGDANALLGFDVEDIAGSGGSFAGAAVSFSLNGTDIDLSTADDDGSISALDVAQAVNLSTSTTGVTAYIDDNDKLHFASNEAFVLADDSNQSGFVASLDSGTNVDSNIGLNAGTFSSAVETGSVVINGQEVTGISLTDKDDAVTTINAAQSNTGVTASLDENGELKLSGNSTITLEVGNANGIAAGNVLGINFVDTSGGADGTLDTQSVNAAIELTSINDTTPISVEVNGNGATATGLKDLNTDISSTVTGSALSNISVATSEGAQAAIESIDLALETINSTRSELGAINNRLDFTVSNLSNVSENSSAARSRIVDADFAAESAALSRAQVLSQASQAILAQANAAPQQVLQLLQG